MKYLWLTVEDVGEPALETICDRLGVSKDDLDPNHGKNGLVHLGDRAGKNAYSVMVNEAAEPNLTAQGVAGPWSDAQFSPCDPSLGAMDPDWLNPKLR